MHNWLTVAQIESETLKDAYKAQKITSTYVNELYRGVILGMFTWYPVVSIQSRFDTNLKVVSIHM